MQIPATQPTIIAPVAGGTFNCWWIDIIHIDARDPANVGATVNLRKCFYDDAGSPVFSESAPTQTISYGDLLNDPDPDVQQATAALITAIVKKGMTAGVL